MDCSGDRFNKYNYLVKQQGVQQIIQLPAFFVFRNVDEILLQTMEGELGFIIDENFHLLRQKITHEMRIRRYLLHKATADVSDFLVQGSGKHHDLLVMRGFLEDVLDVTSHV